MEVSLKLATCPEEILSNEKSILDYLLEGFNANVKLDYMRNLKPALDAIKSNKKKKLDLLWPFLKLGLSANVNLEYHDPEDLKEHPMIGNKVGFKAEDIFSKMGLQKDTLLDHETDLHLFKPICIGQLRDSDAGARYAVLAGFNAIRALLKASESADAGIPFNMKLDLVMEDFAHFGLQLRSTGASKLALLAFNMMAKEFEDEMYEGVKEAVEEH